ncbi:5-oxoprolinase/urea amidolyase family protein [Buttiauxella noackiae]|uniref:5-oxoprolinase/urea amidolyase family protein n=1 Tax=Buttiauxella noackiae TaxID=82992 RepID=UPI0028D4DF76|nr:5-oxoprolinase/urea amidolyase family protein [Buttiauxella noackiae]
MFKRVLIANRGAIAVRIIRTLKQMGITAIAVYAEADKHSQHVRQADIAFSLGDGNVRETYLNQDKLFAILRESGAEAVHPGYGFLSENASFVERCDAENIVFLGPTVEQMAAFGLKHRARELAEQNHVPLLSGSGLLTSLDVALAEAERIGYPVMLKSTAGGGGIGMQCCDNASALKEAFTRVKRLAGNNFSDDGVFLEKFIAHARHIEVQVFGDGAGNVIALGERDCSAQRRNQKVIEETPAPRLSDATRSALHRTAVELCKAVNYRSAGTVEYVYDDISEQFWFLEVNTRLQVEHGVTEMVYGVDIVSWMVALGANELPVLETLRTTPHGHAIQVRVYAEDPAKNFQPVAGLLSEVIFPQDIDDAVLRVDHWLASGCEVSPFYDPMLAKVIVHADSREQALLSLSNALQQTSLYGIETNLNWLRYLLTLPEVQEGRVITATLGQVNWQPATLDVITGGTMTTIQDAPGRSGYWHVGVPPSGPFDNRAFAVGNKLLGNDAQAAGLEITLRGPTLRFNQPCAFVLTGAEIAAKLDDEKVSTGVVINANAGQTLTLSDITGAGCRSYLLLAGGLNCPQYLGSRSTFTLGKFGGHAGRALRAGDVLHLAAAQHRPAAVLTEQDYPQLSHSWQIRVIYGPHGAPEFFTEQDIKEFFAARWQVHYNSSRTGIRLIGPKPTWARSDGGEAGMHPSNIHDNAYAFGTVDFTGDMPVILGPDGPSLGGFVCPATVISDDLWKLGQLKAGDTIEFVAVSLDGVENQMTSPILYHDHANNGMPSVTIRAAGDRFLLVEYGEQMLDIALRFRVHALMQHLEAYPQAGRLELTPGIRSLQIHFDNHLCPRQQLLDTIVAADKDLGDLQNAKVPSRTVWLPLSWDDSACREAITRYTQSVRPGAPWCPSNIEFIRRINGLDSVDEVKKIVFDARYLVMGLGDVYLGAPVATPLDPRHRLVTTKYNPARTWTAENSVGIGGAYMCVYGMEGPGGYQFIGRTLQMWNRDRQTDVFTKPWLLRFFDQIRFYEVSAEELLEIREHFPWGDYPLRIEEEEFCLDDYQQMLEQEAETIDTFQQQRQHAFDEELARWRAEGQFTFDSALDEAPSNEEYIPDSCCGVESQVAGSVWQWLVEPGEQVSAGQTIGILESMKMEIPITSPVDGVIRTFQRQQGHQVHAGQLLMVIETAA